MATGGEEQDIRHEADDETPITPESSKTRTSGIEWDQYFMGVALISAQRSKDPKTQVGACIVNPKNRIVGVGYNGMPDIDIKHNDDKFPWDKQTHYTKNKHLYVCHAEMNAIVNKMGVDIQGCTLYTTKYPCNECSKLIIQSGIKKVVFLENKEPDRDIYAASRILLQTANIVIKEHTPKGDLSGLYEEVTKLNTLL
ncbi:hypothetical protein ACJMK2_039399 [Sinanodonta woodiana]|uniref:dCMP deaminase n=2 Tax=Sinanodonta woodiana TaxID=1069815 RepID=A0ABD3WCQ8_SINWO